MLTLTPARDDQLEAIYHESHGLWGAGLTLADYIGLWRDLRETVWGRRYAKLYVWQDHRGEVLSSVKLYRPKLHLHGHTARATVIGALFTPAAHRGRGHASALMRDVLGRARARGDHAALLFTDIGTSFYNALGFRELPADEHWGALPSRPRAPRGWSLRPMQDGDLGTMVRAHLDFCRDRPLAVIRDAEHWRFVQCRVARFFERLRDPGLQHGQWVALDRGRFAGYLMAIEGRGEWNVREVGAPGGDPAAMAHILRLGAARARRRGLTGFYGWLPPGVLPLLSDWTLHTRRRTRAVPMVLALDGAALCGVATPEQAYLPFQDQF